MGQTDTGRITSRHREQLPLEGICFLGNSGAQNTERMATARTSDDSDGGGDAHGLNAYTFAYIIMPEVAIRVFFS